ncbi:MAG: type III pantothenate kinase [Legionellales bacterium]|nr:type III pantothenate kinase [Legionellales bacterium]
MLLAIDIGNSNIVFGVHDQKTWLRQWRIATHHHYMPDEYAVLFIQLFHEANLHFQQFKQIIISSVVPPVTPIIKHMIETRTSRQPHVLTHESDSGIAIKVNPPSIIGSDLIANAVAAYHLCQQNCIVVDFGTATTLMCVEKPGILLGGAITPGLQTMSFALTQQTSQLPTIELSRPKKIIGNDTISAMQTGLVLGHLGMVDFLIEQLKTELPNAITIATGGLANKIAQDAKYIDRVETWLTLDGLRLVAERI